MKDIDKIVYYVQSLLSPCQIKFPAIIFGAVFNYILPLQSHKESLYAVGALIILDTFTGVVAAWYKHTPIMSSKFSRVLVKIVGYCSVLAVSSIAMQAINIPKDNAITGCLWAMIATEAISIMENVHKLDVAPIITKPIEKVLKIVTETKDENKTDQ